MNININKTNTVWRLWTTCNSQSYCQPHIFIPTCNQNNFELMLDKWCHWDNAVSCIKSYLWEMGNGAAKRVFVVVVAFLSLDSETKWLRDPWFDLWQSRVVYEVIEVLLSCPINAWEEREKSFPLKCGGAELWSSAQCKYSKHKNMKHIHKHSIVLQYNPLAN